MSFSKVPQSFRSLGIQTNLIFHRFSGVVLERETYVVVKTPSRPGYFWGNFILMHQPPSVGDFSKWIDIFETEIGPRTQTGFMTFTWDDPNGIEGDLTEFRNFGFKLKKSVILTAKNVHQPPSFNEELVVRPLKTDQDWEHYVDIHFDPDWEYGSPEGQRHFLETEALELRKMVDAGMGVRFGAFLGKKPIAELGIYWDQHIARFNNVGTHRDYRRRGACGSLVYLASQEILRNRPETTLVMEADPEYHAAKIYESVGFQATQKMCELEWYDPGMMS